VATRPNILVITLDSLRRDHLPFYGYERNTAPNLTRIAERAAVYDCAIADGGWTVPSLASLFTGLCGREHQAERDWSLPLASPPSPKRSPAPATTPPPSPPTLRPALTGLRPGLPALRRLPSRPRQMRACASSPSPSTSWTGRRRRQRALLTHLRDCPAPSSPTCTTTRPTPLRGGPAPHHAVRGPRDSWTRACSPPSAPTAPLPSWLRPGPPTSASSPTSTTASSPTPTPSSPSSGAVWRRRRPRPDHHRHHRRPW